MTLLELQRRMTADVCRPLTRDFAMQSKTEGGESLTTVANTYIKPNDRLSAFERLEIYNRQYWFRTIGAVSEDFPTLEAVLGKKRFEAIVLAYLRETPSRSWNLRDLSEDLPGFLERQSVLTGRRHRLAVDVARLEWAYIEAFDRAELPAMPAATMQTLRPESTLSLQPHLQLLELAFPVDDLVLAIRQGRADSEVVSSAANLREVRAHSRIPSIRRERIYLAVHRHADSIYYRRLEREWFLILQALRDGYTIQQAVEFALKGIRKKVEEQASLVQGCFALAAELTWIADPFLAPGKTQK